MDTPVAAIGNPRRPQDDIHENPWLTLLYLMFVFVPMVFYPRGVGLPRFTIAAVDG